MNPIVLIPARMAATRLPGKPLADINGVPMIVRVLRRAERAATGPVWIAAGDKEIVAAVVHAGGCAVLTDPDLPSGSDRIHAALQIIDPERAFDAVINLQGDLPDLDPEAVRLVMRLLEESQADIATLAAPITEPKDFDNPNVVKPIAAWDGDKGRALYFTRARAPYGEGPLYHHIGIYAYARAALETFVKLPPSPLERREKLEQLRALEAGMSIAIGRVDAAPLSVDTEDDLTRARNLLA
jgi:3-deoxy-manno-octulosonate cytidylyltransferase (CMP-KDO synthetase)